MFLLAAEPASQGLVIFIIIIIIVIMNFHEILQGSHINQLFGLQKPLKGRNPFLDQSKLEFLRLRDFYPQFRTIGGCEKAIKHQEAIVTFEGPNDL